MDSAKIFALGLAAGLAIHVFVRNGARKDAKHAQSAARPPSPSIASKSAKKNKNKKNKNKDSQATQSIEPVVASASAPSPEPEPEPIAKPVEAAPAASTSKKNKKNKKQQQQQQANPQQSTSAESYAEVAAADDAPSAGNAITNDAVRAKSDAAHAALVASLGDMRDADVDELPAGYSSVARIPAPEPAPAHRVSRKDQDDGWSSVGGTFPSTSKASTTAKPNGTATHTSFASTNPFAALPDDATTASVKRLPSKPSAPSGGGWTIATPGPVKSRANGASVVGANGVETKKQRSNANKAAAKKAAKEDAERLQAERLANHRRQQALDAAQQRQAARRPAPHSVSAKTPTAKASVDLNGRLVWD